jgi:hypothetical protein
MHEVFHNTSQSYNRQYRNQYFHKLTHGCSLQTIIVFYGSVAKRILLPFLAITIAFCIIIDLFMAYKYPICDVFHGFCKIARFFATEPRNISALLVKLKYNYKIITLNMFCHITLFF